jgi:hypothetical protein
MMMISFLQVSNPNYNYTFLTSSVDDVLLCISALYGAENWTFRKADEKYLENFEMWRWTRM